MEMQGVLLALLDMPAELTEEYNRWYDLDHMPEHVSKRDVVLGRRYVAPRDLQGLGSLGGDLVAAHAPYLTLYYYGIADFDSADAWGGWTVKDRGLVKSGRFFREGSVMFSQRWRTAGARARASVLVSEEAIPYLAHRGVVVALGRAPSSAQRADALRWWDDVHLPDLLAIDGVLAALRFDPVGDGAPELMAHVLLLEDDPKLVMPRVDAALRYAGAVGRFPPHGGVYESLAFLPYRTIQPLEYDFEL
jgi:hypothetical protein